MRRLEVVFPAPCFLPPPSWTVRQLASGGLPPSLRSFETENTTMHRFMAPVSVFLITLCSALLASAATITVTVGGNGTNKDASLIFQPQEVKAAVWDMVVFNFTNGTHSVIQSTFAEPCVPAHDSNATINGFDSGLRDTVNGTAMTTLIVQILPADQNKTIWFYDLWGCSQGGVGAINANDSDWENFAAFVRNAKRLNGTGGNSSSSISHRPTSTSPVPTSTAAGNSAERIGANTIKAISILTPFLLALLFL